MTRLQARICLLSLTLGSFLNAEVSETPRPLSGLIAKSDPAMDEGWSTETFNEEAGKVLKGLTPFLGDPQVELLPSAFVSASSGSLRPELVKVHEGRGFEVLRPGGQLIATVKEGEFSKSLGAAVQPFKDQNGELRAKFKIVRVDSSDGTISTRVRVEISRGTIQSNAIWLATWQLKDGKPVLQKVVLGDYEEIRASREDLFKDKTAGVMGGCSSFGDQLLLGASHWNANLDVAFGVNQGNQGLAIADVNGDGLEDLYLCQPDGLANLLFVRKADGTLEDRSARTGLDVLDLSRSPLFVDLDNDGDQDFLLTHRSAVSVFRNEGELKFTKVSTLETESRLSGISAADFDNDGDLDFYACGYNSTSQTSPEDIFANPVPYYDALNGAFNYLFRNEGDLKFSDATQGSGFEVANTRFSFTSTWADYDGDGDMDLYVANDFGANNLFQNQLVQSGEARFLDVAGKLGVQDIGAGMSVDWGDVNNDGLLDLYVANMWSSAGGRIAYQDQFKAGVDEETRRLLQRHARGNSLFLQTPDHGFTDVSLEAGVEMGRWAWGSLFVDLNNDGWEDIYTTNGFMTAPDSGDL